MCDVCDVCVMCVMCAERGGEKGLGYTVMINNCIVSLGSLNMCWQFGATVVQNMTTHTYTNTQMQTQAHMHM